MISMDTWEGVADIYTKIFTNFAAGDFIALMHKAGFPLVIVVIGYAMHFLPKRVNGIVIGWITRSGFVGQLLILVVTIWIVMQAQMMLAGDGGLPVYAAF